MSRLSVYQMRLERFPGILGHCMSDLPSICSYLNKAQRQLIRAGGNEGWLGSYASMAFNVTPCSDPYITTPRDVARLIAADVCRHPVRIQNQFYEYLEFGCGLQRQTPNCAGKPCGCDSGLQIYDRGTVPLMRDITPGNKLRIYMTNGADNGKRIFFNAKDGNGNQIYTLDRGNQVDGFFVTLDNMVPFVESPMNLSSISGILKDETVGPVRVFGVNPSTDEQTLLATFAPNETAPCYRRYFLHNLPERCHECDAPIDSVQVTAMAKLEFIPVASDTDFLLIGNPDALTEECQAIRYGEMDTANALQMAEYHHKRAVRILNQELVHYLGKDRPAMGFSPFGSATLENAGVGLLI